MGYTVLAKCAGGHAQEIEIDDMLGIQWAQEYASLLDGTSSLFLRPPIDSGEVVGRCGICGMKIECKVLTEKPKQEA